jgi:purine-nucleoside phosphorylase
VLLTNAAGGLRPGMQPGDLMLMADHINFMSRNPLIGRAVPGEERFPDMSDPYDSRLRELAERVALELRIPLSQGVYAALLGPSYETPAEIRMLARLGADAVGMSTVPEVLVARALGLRCIGISCITNLAAGLGGATLSHDEVMEVGAAVRERMVALVRGILPQAAGLNQASEAAS